MGSACNWPGLVNARELGGLRCQDGKTTRSGALFRSEHPRHLTAGWDPLFADGVRRVVRLTTDGLHEEHEKKEDRPCEIELVSVAVEDFSDADFVAQWVETDLWCSTLHYPDVLRRWPGMYVDALRAIASAPMGGVLVHCQAGRDRTGIVCALALHAVGVAPEAIIADYHKSLDCMRPTERDAVSAALLSRNGRWTEGLEQLLTDSATHELLRAGGADDELIGRLRQRLVG